MHKLHKIINIRVDIYEIQKRNQNVNDDKM